MKSGHAISLGDTDVNGIRLNHVPKVSVVLPIYNRAHFLPQAISSIMRQTLRDWELIVVDDGSTDDPAPLISSLSRESPNPIKLLSQENQGPAAARNLGIRNALGEYIAFFDSDDTWEAGHLSACVRELEKNPDLDWIYTSFQRVKLATGETIDTDIFFEGGKPARLLALNSSVRGELHIIDDADALRTSIEHGLCIGLRTSVVRRRVFQVVEFPLFRIGEDQALYPRALINGMKFGYLLSVQATAYVHDENISEVAGVSSGDKYVKTLTELIRAFESLRDLDLSSDERRALERRIGNEYFWNLGYRCLCDGHDVLALDFFRRGMKGNPWNAIFWKTYMVAILRVAMRRLSSRLYARFGGPFS